MKRLGWQIVLLVWMLVLGSCAPIDGLNQQEESTTVALETTTAATTTTAPPVTEPETEPPTMSIEVNWIKVKADALNVRKDAGVDFQRLTKVYDGQIYEVLNRKKDLEGVMWYQIKAADGIAGWVSSEFCIPGESYNDLTEDE